MEPDKTDQPSPSDTPSGVVVGLPVEAQPTPSQPVVAAVLEQQPSSRPKLIKSFNTSAYKRRRPWVWFALALIVLALIAAAGYKAYIYVREQPIKYSMDDVEFHTTVSYEFQTPKSWTQLANDSAFVKYQVSGRGNSTDISSLNDLQTYAHNLKGTNNEGADSYVVIASIPFPEGEGELKSVASNAGLHTQFESDYAASVQSDPDCQSIGNESRQFLYNTSHFLVEIIDDYDCTYTPENQSKFGLETAHIHGISGFKNDKFYAYILASESSIWNKNQEYFRAMAEAFKPH